MATFNHQFSTQIDAIELTPWIMEKFNLIIAGQMNQNKHTIVLTVIDVARNIFDKNFRNMT